MTGVILFRAQPFHNGHLHMVKTAIKDCISNLNSDLHIFIGSADKYGTPRNPLPIELREDLVRETLRRTLPASEFAKVHIHRLNDLTDEADNSLDWGKYLYKKITERTHDEAIQFYYTDTPQIMLSWFEGSDLLQEVVSFKFLDRYKDISATKVRKAILDNYAQMLTLIPSYVYENKDKIKKYLEEAYNK